MHSFIEEQLTRHTTAPLTASDKEKLIYTKANQFFVMIMLYLGVIVFCFYLLKTGGYGLDVDSKSFRVNFTEDDVQQMRAGILYFALCLFLIATFFFTRAIVRKIIPLGKDINNSIKHLLYYKPAKLIDNAGYYYLSIPLAKHKQVEVDQQTFESIADNDELCLEMLPVSVIATRLVKGSTLIRYY